MSKVCPYCGGRKMETSVGCMKCYRVYHHWQACVNQVTSRMFPVYSGGGVFE